MQKYKKTLGYIVVTLALLQSKVVSAYSWLDKKPEKNTFAKLIPVLQDFFSSMYGLAITTGLTILLMLSTIIGAKISISNGKNRHEGKMQFINFLYGALIFASALAIVSLCLNIGKKIR